MRKRSVIWIVTCVLCVAATIASGAFALTLTRSRGSPASGGHSSQASSESGIAPSSSTDISAVSSQSVPSHSSTPPGSSSQGGSSSAAPAATFRAVWITSVKNTNFPSKQGLTVAEQKKEIDAIVDKSKSIGLNTVIVQVRPNADALYKSQYFPWSVVLTGTQGKDPGYDPMQYFISAAHGRGLKFVAWVNPYRIQTVADTSLLAPSSPAIQHQDWTVTGDDGGLYFNPGLPQTKQLVEDGVMEIVNNYNIDSIVFDDYFYPNQNFADSATYQELGGGLTLGDWRRANITSLISEMHSKIKASKKNVSFGVSPFAVWANKSVNPAGSDTAAGVQSYYDQSADTRLWVKKGYVDYIIPQIAVVKRFCNTAA